MSNTQSEGEVKLKLKLDTHVASKELDVFYNPLMKHNRDVSLCVVKQAVQKGLIGKKGELSLCLPLAGSGVRGVRFLKELKSDVKTTIHFNDKSEEAISAIKAHLELNDIDSESYRLSHNDANVFMHQMQTKMDYLDLDPFGSPNPFLDAAAHHTSRNCILAVTATDTAPLCGTYIEACERNYNATPIKCSMRQEMGLRILIRKAQVVAAQYGRALVPLFSYPKDHYMRIYFHVTKQKKVANEIYNLQKVVYFSENKQEWSFEKSEKYSIPCGPLFTGDLFDSDFCDDSFYELLTQHSDDEQWIETIKSEFSTKLFGYYHLHTICGVEKIQPMPKFKYVFEKLEECGFVVAMSAFEKERFRTNASYEKIVSVMKELLN